VKKSLRQAWRVFARAGPIAWLLGAIVASAVLFLGAPEIDLAVARWLRTADDRDFVLAYNLLAHYFNGVIPALATLCAVFILTGLVVVAIKRVPFFGLTGRELVYLFLCFALAPGLITNTLLKDNWDRARPSHLTEFGGDKSFSPPLVISDQCASNCSFVSGDAALAFTLIAFAFVVARYRRRIVLAGVLFGSLIGFIRMGQGAHFLSDVVFAGLFVCLTIMLLKAVVLERRWGISAAVESVFGLFSTSGGARGERAVIRGDRTEDS